MLYFDLSSPTLTQLTKSYFDGTQRLSTPLQTFDRIQPWLKHFGITRVANVTHLDRIGIPVVTVIRPNSKAVAVAQGKGIDLLTAKVSGIMEAIESYCAEHIQLPLRHATARELQENLIDLSRLPKLSINTLDQDQHSLWLQGQELNTGKTLFVPYEVVHSNYTLPLQSGTGAFMMTTNGLASGNHWLEALNHGICELIERDATSLWQLRGGLHDRSVHPHKAKTYRRLDLHSIDHAHCQILLEKLWQADIEVAVWETTTDIQIPSFYCTIIDKQYDPLQPLYPASGAGTSLDKAIALSRALTEAVQTRLTMISGSRDDVLLNQYEHGQQQALHSRVLESIQNEQYIKPYAEIIDHPQQTLLQDFQTLQQQLQRAQLEQMVALDLTLSPYNIPVVRVIIPGLEGIQDIPGYSPGTRATAAMHTLSY